MNKDGSQAVLNYLLQQLDLTLQDMKADEETRNILSNSLKQFYNSEILFNDAKNTFLSQEPLKSTLSSLSPNDNSQYNSSLLSFSPISPLSLQSRSNNPTNFMNTQFNSSNLIYQHQVSSNTSSFHNLPDSSLNRNVNNQISDNNNGVSSNELIKLLNRVSLLKMIDDTPIPAKTKPNDFSKKTRPWTLKEDNRLLAAIMRFGLDNWSKVSKFVGNNRTRGQCSQRWSRGLNPSISRVEWNPKEDSMLMNYVKIHGNKRWSKISSLLGNRSDVQCRYRYKQLIKKKSRSFPDISTSIEDNNNANETINDTKENNSNTNETEYSINNTDDSNIEENIVSNDFTKNIITQHREESVGLPNNNLDFQIEKLNIPKPIFNSQTKSSNNEKKKLTNIEHIDILINDLPVQNPPTKKIPFPIPDSSFDKRIPSLNMGVDIDTFLSKFKE